MAPLLVMLLSIASPAAWQEAWEREWEVEELDLPVPANACWPHLGADPDTGRTWLAWTEEIATGHALVGTSFRAGIASPPRTFAAGESWFVNWADVPRIAARGEHLMITWLDRLGKGTYAYGVRYALSADGGNSWSKPALLHDDATPTEHGFASLVPLADGGFAAAWLDGRAMGGGGHGSEGGHGAMSMRVRRLRPDAGPGDEIVLDERVCECCPTDMVALADGRLVVAYRDRSETEVRDIVVQAGRATNRDSWSRVYESGDGWTIPGCPVNGPSLSAFENRVALAWYTGAGDRAHVRLSFSDAGLEEFGPAVDFEEVNASGRVQVVHTGDGAALCWMDLDPEIGAEWLFRFVSEESLEMGDTLVLGSAEGDRSAGYPTMQRVGDRILCAFTRSGEGTGVQVLSIRPR